MVQIWENVNSSPLSLSLGSHLWHSSFPLSHHNGDLHHRAFGYQIELRIKRGPGEHRKILGDFQNVRVTFSTDGS